MTEGLKNYPLKWKGDILLACRKCQKKLKSDRRHRALAKLKKTVKRFNKKHPDRAFEVINVPCMDLCPKYGVTVRDPRKPDRLSILRTEEDIEFLVL